MNETLSFAGWRPGNPDQIGKTKAAVKTAVKPVTKTVSEIPVKKDMTEKK